MEINFAKQIPRPLVIPASLRQRGSLFELLILVVVGILFFWFIISPKNSELSNQKSLVESLSAESAKLSDQQKELDSLIRQLDASSKDISKLDESLPLHPRTTWMYLLVESLVQSSGMAIGGLSVSNQEADIMAGNTALLAEPFSAQRVLKRVAVNLSVSGTFSQFQSFLEKVENSGRIFDIKTLDISSSSNELLDFRLSLDAYYFTPPVSQ